MSNEPFANPPAELLSRDVLHEDAPEARRSVVVPLPPHVGHENTSSPRRRRGRPLEMSADHLLHVIRQLSSRTDGLFKIHVTAPGLYARARRLFGTWSSAVLAAGVDYELMQSAARARSRLSRRGNRISRRAASHG